MILDPRISILGLKKYWEIQDCVRQILNKNQCQIFNQHKENFGFIQREALPSDFSDTFDQEKYQKSQKYTKTNTKYSIFKKSSFQL